ncbi:hypothetical protein FRC03_001598 [Tulasnella sp. 419]|nr:hypothetical protein FRC03_001598 [Tulasnella sp. 419]
MEAPNAAQAVQVTISSTFVPPTISSPAPLYDASGHPQADTNGARASITESHRESVHFRDSITIADRLSRIGSRLGDKEASSPVQAIKPAPLKKFQHQFWDPEVLALRRIYGKIMIRIVVLLVLFMWVTIPVYFGSLASQANHVPQMHGWLVNFDEGGELGRHLEETFTAISLGQTNIGKAHLRWDLKNRTDLNGIEDVAYAVEEDHAWAAIVVNFNATNNLIEARATGDASYNASSAITFLYNQARNEVAANNYIVPYTVTQLQESLARFSQNFTAEYMRTLQGTGSLNSTNARPGLDQVIQFASQAPQTLSQPFWFTLDNVRPYTAPVAGAVLLIGSIYICIFSYVWLFPRISAASANPSTTRFIVTLTNAAAREIIGPFLTTKSYIIMRIVVPLCAYLPLSFSYAMISLPFHLPFGAK